MDANLIRNHHLFRGAAASDLEAITALVERQELIRGDTVFLSGTEATALYVIESGTLEVMTPGKDLPVVTVGAGQGAGELPFFHGQHHAAAARAKEATRLLRIPYAGLAALLEKRPQLANQVYRNAAAFYARLLARLAAELEHPYF